MADLHNNDRGYGKVWQPYWNKVGTVDSNASGSGGDETDVEKGLFDTEGLAYYSLYKKYSYESSTVKIDYTTASLKDIIDKAINDVYKKYTEGDSNFIMSRTDPNTKYYKTMEGHLSIPFYTRVYRTPIEDITEETETVTPIVTSVNTKIHPINLTPMTIYDGKYVGYYNVYDIVTQKSYPVNVRLGEYGGSAQDGPLYISGVLELNISLCDYEFTSGSGRHYISFSGYARETGLNLVSDLGTTIDFYDTDNGLYKRSWNLIGNTFKNPFGLYKLFNFYISGEYNFDDNGLGDLSLHNQTVQKYDVNGEDYNTYTATYSDGDFVSIYNNIGTFPYRNRPLSNSGILQCVDSLTFELYNYGSDTNYPRFVYTNERHAAFHTPARLFGSELFEQQDFCISLKSSAASSDIDNTATLKIARVDEYE